MTFEEGPILHLLATKAPKDDQRQSKTPKRNHTQQEDILQTKTSDQENNTTL